MANLLTFELTNIRELAQRFAPAIVDKALKRTLDRMQTSVGAIVSKDVRSFYNVSAARIKKDLRLQRVTVGGKPGRVLLYVGERIGLKNFGGTVKNVTVEVTRKTGKTYSSRRAAAYHKVLRNGERKRSKHKTGALGFAATGNNSNYHFFARLPNSKKTVALMGPSVPHMVNRKTLDKVNDLLDTKMPAEFNRNLNFYLGKQVGLY